MSQTPQTQPQRYTLEEYFRLERDSSVKHEFRHGEIIDMSGGTPSHSLITANVVGELRGRLKGSPCRVYDSNLRIRIAKKVRYAYPDASVICDEPQYDPLDPSRLTVTNPRLVVEVLSPSTEKYDRGDKFLYYLELESLEEYVIVAQDAPRVETLFRQGDGTWLLAFAMGRDAVARLRSLRIDLPLNEVYAGVEFPPLEDAP
jgi:Uma2 family endonuclease